MRCSLGHLLRRLQDLPTGIVIRQVFAGGGWGDQRWLVRQHATGRCGTNDGITPDNDLVFDDLTHTHTHTPSDRIADM